MEIEATNIVITLFKLAGVGHPIEHDYVLMWIVVAIGYAVLAIMCNAIMKRLDPYFRTSGDSHELGWILSVLWPFMVLVAICAVLGRILRPIDRLTEPPDDHWPQ